MNTRVTLLPTLASLLTAFLVAAPSEAGIQEPQDVPGKTQEAAIRRSPLATPIAFHVEGLTQENTEIVRRSLTALMEGVYVCPGCSEVAPEAGRCTPCDMDLELKQKPILSEAKVSLKDSNIELTAFAARHLSYSTLEGALKKNKVRIDGEQFALSGDARLVLRGGEEKDLKAIQKALQATGFFETAKATYDAESKEIHVVVHANSTPPTHDEVTEAIEKLESKAELLDVVWGPQPTPLKG